MRNDYTGKKFGMLTFVKYDHSDGKNAWWVVKCECGTTRTMRSCNVRNPNNVSCGCHRNKQGRHHNAWRGSGKIGSSFVSMIRRYAKAREIEVDKKLDTKYLWNLYLDQNGKCALSEDTLTIPRDYRPGWTTKTNMSLDRIDSSKGYVVGNVQWVTKMVNFMKQQYPQEDFIEMCEKIARHKGDL